MTTPEIEEALKLLSLSEKAEKSYNDKNYEFAQKLWLQKFEKQKLTEEKIDTALKIAKCDLRLGKNIRDENMKRISDVAQQMKLSGKEIRDLAEIGRDEVDSLILFFVASQSGESEPNIQVENMLECINQVHLKLKKLSITDYPAVQNLLPSLKKMMMQEVGGADKKIKTEKVAWGLSKIAYILNRFKDYKNAILIAEEGIELMKKQFQSDANKHDVVSALYSNCGFAHKDLGNLVQSVQCYAQSITACKEATDIDEDYRKKWINKAKNHMRSFNKLERSEQDKLRAQYPIISSLLAEKTEDQNQRIKETV